MLMWTPLGFSQSVLIRGGVLISGVVLYTQDEFKTACSVCITVNLCISGVSTRLGSTAFLHALGLYKCQYSHVGALLVSGNGLKLVGNY